MKEDNLQEDKMTEFLDTEVDLKESLTITDQKAEVRHQEEDHSVRVELRTIRRNPHIKVMRGEFTSALSTIMMMRKISLTIILLTLVLLILDVLNQLLDWHA